MPRCPHNGTPIKIREWKLGYSVAFPGGVTRFESQCILRMLIVVGKDGQ